GAIHSLLPTWLLTVLCSNSLLESTDYWLQNQRTPCRIGFVEDKSENNCASVCFVNLDANKDDCSDELIKQRLISVSPNLPKLISSMNVQPPKENEIILLSGLTSGNLQADFEVPQCSWLADVCLVQCARGNRKNSTSCIIFEINKFLIGLELVQEKQLQIEAKIVKPEDDTNCSVSSIEEDFLTASEHLEDENDTNDYRTGHEKLNALEAALEIKKHKGKGLESLHYKKGRLPFTFEDNCVDKDNVAFTTTSIYSEEALSAESGVNVLQNVGKSIQQLHRKIDLAGKTRTSPHTNNLEGSLRSEVENSHLVHASEDASLTKMAKEGLASLCDAIAKQNSNLDPEDYRDERQPHHPHMQNEQATAGQYATNLAESVLQDAFIRLSQTQSTFTKETAVSIPVGNSLTSTTCTTEDMTASRSWNELPKIVIVQSPDSCENPLEWPGSSFPNLYHCPESESSAKISDCLHEESSNGHTQSALEVALACAATVIGTISSPQATERLKREKEATDFKSNTVDNEELQTNSSQVFGNCTDTEYSFPSALCGMTQVATAVAVCSLGETKDDKYPVTSSGLLSAAEASTAITLHCSIAIGSSMEKLNDSIAEALLKEASIILTKPNAYRNVGDFMESINGKIIETVTRPRIARLDEVISDELAQNLSNVILRHSVEEVRKKRQLSRSGTSNSDLNTQDIFIEATNELLFNVLYFTCKKMSDIAQFNECPPPFSEDASRCQVTGMEKQLTETPPRQSEQALDHFSNKPFSTCSPSINSDKDLVTRTNTIKDSKGKMIPNILETTTLHVDLPHSASGHSSLSGKTSPKKRYLKRTTRDCYKSSSHSTSPNKKALRSLSGRENTLLASECRHGVQNQQYSDATVNAESQEKNKCDAVLNNEVQVSMSLLGNHVLLPPQPALQVRHSADKYCITDFAEELAETVVSMATEIAAICLENSNSKQPWFCAWKRGNEYLMSQSLSCRTMKRKKETQQNGAVVRKHRPPRLSEIKRKTDEHPELKERLMNRVVDESINLEDAPDSVNIFANEVAAKIMNLTELSMVDNIWQGSNHPRNRLHCERWSRAQASSCESIPEEDSDSKGPANTLGPVNALGQPGSRTSSVSKQSSCESITDEFSRFMVNQMENEGRGFYLLLDYYAGKNANSILTSALQQVARKNGHLNVRPNCPSKQSSTESITEEFYRYMLRDIEKENKESFSSARSSKDWSSSLLPPSPRSPFCFRQSSMPDSRSSGSRLTVTAPVKANSLDVFAHNSHQDSLGVQPVSAVSSSGLCKSDSCLYQRGRTDQITDMLIHETWANSIESLMRKNKIIVDDMEDTDPDQFATDSPPHVEQFANRLTSNIVQSGKTLIVVHQDSFDYTHTEPAAENGHLPKGPQSSSKSTRMQTDLDVRKEHLTNPGSLSINHTSFSACPREVPLIQIETDQREELEKEQEPLTSSNIHSGKTKEHLNIDNNVLACYLISLTVRSGSNAETMVEAKAAEEFPNPLSSSDESTGSWTQLVNDEDNPDDTSSYLQLSERSMSNGNSSTTSSLECTSGLSVGTANCQKDLVVINFDLEPECPDAELRATLQWIAASELGIPTIYFKKSQENRIEKFLDVVRLVHQKSWKVGDIFHAVVQFCKLHEESRELMPSLFDWLLELG
uniref:SPHK1 interactor, AKAP domain containing n=1 Tax=Sphenodon punctatus TaxID=8508 RepID=A0A8D0GEE9_SPHPU